MNNYLNDSVSYMVKLHIEDDYKAKHESFYRNILKLIFKSQERDKNEVSNARKALFAATR